MEIPQRLYDEIRRNMPIPCVDLMVVDSRDRVLLLRRANTPARGEWWFPGGRIWIGETRLEAVDRKLWEETGLRASAKLELGTSDLIFRETAGELAGHGITTLYRVEVQGSDVRIDKQSLEVQWHSPVQWLSQPLHSFIRSSLTLLCSTAQRQGLQI
jgi:colanic acid biosynthesis protein WcaH